MGASRHAAAGEGHGSDEERALDRRLADATAGELIARIQRGESSLESVVSHLAAEVLAELEPQAVETSKRQDRAATVRERSTSNQNRPDVHRDKGAADAQTEPSR